jgi:hypothetical protein
MVVREQYRGRALNDGWFENFAGMNKRRIQCSHGYLNDALNPMFRIETCNNELFLVIGWMQTPIALEESFCVLRIGYAGTVVK